MVAVMFFEYFFICVTSKLAGYIIILYYIMYCINLARLLFDLQWSISTNQRDNS